VIFPLHRSGVTTDLLENSYSFLKLLDVVHKPPVLNNILLNTPTGPHCSLLWTNSFRRETWGVYNDEDSDLSLLPPSSPWRWRQHGPPKRWYPNT